MNNTRRSVLKTSGALGTLVALGLITEKQALAQANRAGFEAKSLADALKHTPEAVEALTFYRALFNEEGVAPKVGIPNTRPVRKVRSNCFYDRSGSSAKAGTRTGLDERWLVWLLRFGIGIRSNVKRRKMKS